MNRVQMMRSFRSGDFQDIVKLAQLPDQSFLQDRLSALGIELSDDALSEISELARDRTRDQEDANTRAQRAIAEAQIHQRRELIDINTQAAEATSANTLAIEALTAKLQGVSLDDEQTESTTEIASESAAAAESSQEDVDVRENRQRDTAEADFTKSREQIIEEAQETATAIRDALTPLLQSQQESSTATLESETAQTQSETATLQSETASLESQTAQQNAETSTLAQDVATRMNQVTEQFQAIDVPGLFAVVKQSAEASLGIKSAIEGLPGLLETSFTKIFSELETTFSRLVEIESGAEVGTAQALLRDFPELLSAQQPLDLQNIQPILGTEQTTPIEPTPAPNALQAAGGASVSSVSITAQSVSVSGPIQGSPAQQSGDTIIRVENILELDGDKVAENTENHIINRRGEGRSLLNG